MKSCRTCRHGEFPSPTRGGLCKYPLDPTPMVLKTWIGIKGMVVHVGQDWGETCECYERKADDDGR